LVVNKAAGVVCHPTKKGELCSLIGRVRKHLGPDSHPQLVNRLDRETGGVTLIAKRDKDARALRRLWEGRKVEKANCAIIHGRIPEENGLIEAPLGKDEQSRVATKDCVRPAGAPATTEYWVLRQLPGPSSLLCVQPYTGRKHQIRIHLAHIGHPILGDKLYGG